MSISQLWDEFAVSEFRKENILTVLEESEYKPSQSDLDFLKIKTTENNYGACEAMQLIAWLVYDGKFPFSEMKSIYQNINSIIPMIRYYTVMSLWIACDYNSIHLLEQTLIKEKNEQIVSLIKRTVKVLNHYASSSYIL